MSAHIWLLPLIGLAICLLLGGYLLVMDAHTERVALEAEHDIYHSIDQPDDENGGGSE